MFEAVNLILAAVIIFNMAGTKSHGNLLFLLFSYASLHFSFAAIPLINGAAMTDLIEVHLQGSGMLAKLSGIMVLIAAFLILCRNFKFTFAGEKKLIYLFLIALVAITIGGLLNIRAGDWIQLVNVVATCGMLILMILLASYVDNFEWEIDKGQLCFVILMQVVMFVIAFYEVYSLRYWGHFMNSNGEIVHRASSLLFNPNLYGMWCAILAIVFSYLFHQNIGKKFLILFALTLAFGGLYLSGSRSAGFMTLFLLVFIALTISANIGWKRWVTVLTMLSSFFVLNVGSNWMGQLFPKHFDNWSAISLLGERFLVYPMQLLGYLLNHFSLGIEVPNEIVISIEGRFNGELKDAGWLVLFDDTGWLGVIGVMGVWGLFLVWSVNTYRKRRDTTSVYAIAMLIFSILWGAVLRFQVFPTGLFMATILAPCIVYWKNAIDTETKPIKLK